MKFATEQPRFLICRLSAIGDTVHTLPLANAIKSRWPRAFVAWVVEKAAAPLVQGHAAVDEVVVAPKGFMRSPQLLWDLAQKLGSLKVEVAFDPQSLTKSAVCAMLSGARTRIGFTKPVARELAPWINSTLVAPRETHVVPRYLEVLRPLGISLNSPREIEFGFRRDCAAEGTVDSLLASSAISQFALINPGAGWDSKVWPAERYAEVAQRLSIPSVVVWAGEQEKIWAKQICEASGGRALLAPPTSLLELASLARRSRVFIGSDTGPLHLAAAVGTPCVAIFGPTRKEVCGPFGEQHVVLQAAYDDLGAQRKAKGTQSSAMLAVTADDVLAASELILARGVRKAA